MPWKRRVLIVANVTADSDELMAALSERGQREPTFLYLIVPATPVGGGRSAAHATLDEALARLRAAGLEADGTVGAGDPIAAITDAWDPKRYDEIVVSTLPIGVSKWLRAGLPQRVERLTGAPVTHVVSHPRVQTPRGEPAPEHHDRGVLMGTLSVLACGSAPPEHGRQAP